MAATPRAHAHIVNKAQMEPASAKPQILLRKA